MDTAMLPAPSDAGRHSSPGRHRPATLPLLAGLGRLTARRPWWFIVFWVVVTVVSFLVSLGLVGTQGLFDRLSNGEVIAPGESSIGRDLVTTSDDEGAVLMLRADGVEDLLDPGLTDAVTGLVEELADDPAVAEASSPMTTPGWPQEPAAYALVADQDPEAGSFVVVATLEAEATSEQETETAALLDSLGAEALAPFADALTVGGGPLLFEDIVHQIERDLITGEAVAIPISLLVMVVVFGGFVAAGMPIAGAIASIGGALAILFGFSFVIDLDATVVNIVTVMGLALCIDYGLLLVSRFREEVRLQAPDTAHRDLTDEQVEWAVVGAVASAGRTVLFSALIVGISLSGLVVFDAPIMRAIGAAGVSVVMVALLVALTLVPALCAVGARRLGKRRGAEVAPDDGWFSRLARVVQRRPAVTTAVAVTLLLGAATPALEMRLTSSGAELLPPGAEQRVFFETLDEDFPALAFPAVTVVAQAPPDEVQAWAEDEVAGLPGVELVAPPEVVGPPPPGVSDEARPGQDLVTVVVRTEGGPQDDAAREVTRILRDLQTPFPTWVTGQASGLADFTDAVRAGAPWAALWIIGATFVLLFLLTGSVVIPVKALLLNIVSLGASLGILVWVFQQGHLESLLRFESVGAIESVIPLLVLAFGFGLSMDYEVFLLSRIIELHEQGVDDDTAVRLGLQRSGRIITSAALIMVIVFAGFAAGQMLVIKQTGFALAVAVAIDATIVRMVVVPATMTMLGRWNWWAPSWLTPVHRRFGITEHAPPVPR
ncbi:MMPL family transporter [Ornithinimicrobium sediminis]|uniref:MMPL family transporter n=1 Tax=Ornithinimicrobium sediminis TaxID=2904603 RepID=UPI001E2C65EA|nr:MMPL family transporter [Ornithinimicrobium sediminis]